MQGFSHLQAYVAATDYHCGLGFFFIQNLF